MVGISLRDVSLDYPLYGAYDFSVKRRLLGRLLNERSEMRTMLDEFKALGGRGLEVVSGSHSVDNVSLFGRLAREYGFLASCGSDFHGPGESYVDLGRTSPLPLGLTPIWEAF